MAYTEKDCGQTADREMLIRASVLGLAIGDSLGADIAFLSLPIIRQRFPSGFDDLPVHAGLRGAVTDDTQMTLFTAEGILQARDRFRSRGIANVTEMVHQGAHTLADHAGRGSARTPSARPNRPYPRPASARPASARHDLPVGSVYDRCLWRSGNKKQQGLRHHYARCTCRLVHQSRRRSRHRNQTSALTHGHPTGQLAAAAWAELLADVMAGGLVSDIAVGLASEYAVIENGGETSDAIRKALAAPWDGAPETVETLGGGWIAEEALSIALYACLCARSLEHGLTIAVTHSGDSDSTGAVAGSLLGIMYPEETLNHRWAEQVECRDLVERIIEGGGG